MAEEESYSLIYIMMGVPKEYVLEEQLNELVREKQYKIDGKTVIEVGILKTVQLLRRGIFEFATPWIRMI